MSEGPGSLMSKIGLDLALDRVKQWSAQAAMTALRQVYRNTAYNK